MQILIDDAPISWVPGSWQVQDSIGQRSTCGFTVLDGSGASKYVANQLIEVQDDSGLRVFAGLINDSKRTRESKYISAMLHAITCVDWHALADRRVAATSYTSQTCGAMVADLITNYLAQDGVQTLNNVLAINKSNVETDTTGFTSNNGSTITRTTSEHWQGTAALQVACPGVVSGEGFKVNVPSAGIRAGMRHTFSLYIKGSGNIDLRMQNNDTGATVGSVAALTLTSSWQRLSVTADLPTPLPSSGVNLRIGTNGIQAITYYADGLQVEQSDYATPWVVGQTSYIQAGPTVTSYVVNYKTLAAAFDDLALLAGFYWVIDANRNLHFAAQSTNTAPWTLDGTQPANASLQIQETQPLYRNAQWTLGGQGTTGTQTEAQKGDGSRRSFVLQYPVHAVPSDIHINSAAPGTIGILGVDTGKDWYWNKGSNVITQDNAGTLVASTDTFHATYVGEYPITSYSEDLSAVGDIIALEGGTTSGLIEQVQTDASLVTTAQAFQSGAALLAKFATSGEIVTFTTKVAGLRAGQLLPVSLPAVWQFASPDVLIQTVSITHDDFEFWYSVTALSGPANTTWVDFFKAIASTQFAIDTSQGGASSVVAILAAFTIAYTWAMSYTATVYACPLFPATFPLTLC